MRTNIATSLSVMIIAIGLYAYASTLPEGLGTGVRESLGPRFFPQVVAVVMVLLSLWLLVQTLIGRLRTLRNSTAHPATQVNDQRDAGALKGVVLSVVLLGAYVAAIGVLGYYTSTFMYVFGMLIFLSRLEAEKSRLIRFLVIGLSSVGLIHIVFERLLWVFLPRGLLL